MMIARHCSRLTALGTRSASTTGSIRTQGRSLQRRTCHQTRLQPQPQPSRSLSAKVQKLPAAEWPPRQSACFSTSTARQREAGDGNGSNGNGRQNADEPSLLAKMGESAATTFASVFVLAAGFALAAYAYHKSYKHMQLRKIAGAFEPGDPVLTLASMGKGAKKHDSEEHWVERKEQKLIDSIVNGEEKGHYYLLMGEKGCGKSSMLLESMQKIDGEGVAMLEAHADLEIFRARLGKALDYEYHEDYIGGYFSERGPRESTALLDIERALNKLEKVAIDHRKSKRKPLIIIVNNCHLIRDDDDGKDLLELLQQRAESWAAANVVTVIFNSDDYWIYERFKRLGTRMSVMPILDLPKAEAVSALAKYRRRYHKLDEEPSILEEVYNRVGGRLSFLNRVAKSRDMLATCDDIKEKEKTFFLNQCWILGEPMDDDVMDQQKWASAAMVLAYALVELEDKMDMTYCPDEGHLLPSMPMHKAQETQTRADFIRELDRLNLFTITSDATVRASSVPMHRAFKEICALPNFREYIDQTLDRISAIESLGRTREILAKDLVHGGKYRFTHPKGWGGDVEMSIIDNPWDEKEDEADDGDDKNDDGKGDGKQ